MTLAETNDSLSPSMQDDEKHWKNEKTCVIASTLAKTYDEMRTRQRKAILQQDCMRSDPYFAQNPARLDDDRRCLAISCVLDDSNLSSNASSEDCVWTDAYWELQNRLKELSNSNSNAADEGTTNNECCSGDLKDDSPKTAASKHIYFDQTIDLEGGVYGQLHWTVMQLVGFPDYNDEIHDNCVYGSSAYMDCVQDALIVGGMDTAVKIHYIGCIAVSSGLLMIGIPTSVNANSARDCIREKLKERGLPLKEPFVNDIVHSTLFRVTNKKEDEDKELHHKILDIAKEFEQVHLGTVTLRNFQIGPASWRMLPTELDATPAWRKWTLPDESTQQQYQNAVIGAPENRSCFTVSGASGANLAKEIRDALSSFNGATTRDDNKDKNNLEPSVSDLSENDTSKFCKFNTITEERADGNLNEKIATMGHGFGSLSSFKMADGMNSQHYSDNGYVGPICLHTELLNEELDAGHEEVEAVLNTNKNAATISGAAGLALAQELQKRLEMEKRSLLQSYNRDFY